MIHVSLLCYITYSRNEWATIILLTTIIVSITIRHEKWKKNRYFYARTAHWSRTCTQKWLNIEHIFFIHRNVVYTFLRFIWPNVPISRPVPSHTHIFLSDSHRSYSILSQNLYWNIKYATNQLIKEWIFEK